MNKKTNIILIGMRGSGKSTIGRLLAKKSGKTFYDTDTEIEKKWGKTIPQIVDDEGWEGFRKKESEICEEMGERQNAVIATGGGVVLSVENMEHLEKNGICIFLQADISVLAQRIRGDGDQRPSLTGKDIAEELQEIWEERKGVYKKYADFIIEANENGNKITKNILSAVQ